MRRPYARIMAVLFALVWASAAWFGSWELNPNNATRLFAALSIVEDGDATINEWDALTIDKAYFDGNIYLDKAPGMTLMALPAVGAMALLSPERSRDFPLKTFYDQPLARFLRLRTRIAAATGPALLTAVAAVLLFDLALSVTGSGGAALAAALGYGLGTPAWGWSTTITGHAVVAALFVVALWAAWRGGLAPRRRYSLIVGGALGWAVVVENQAVIAGALIAVWAACRVWRTGWRWRFVTLAAGAGVAAMLPLIGYNLFAFGEPLRFGYSGVRGFEGMRQGLFGLGMPSPTVLWRIVVGPERGMLWVAPVLMVAPPGLAALARRAETRGLALTAAGVAVAALLVNAAYVYWEGGNSTGPRHALPLVGVAALGIAAFWMELGRVGRAALALLLGVSVAINAAIAAAEVFAPPYVGLSLRFAVWPRVRAGDLRTIPNEWWDWTPRHGFALWAVPAALALGWLVAAVRRAEAP